MGRVSGMGISSYGGLKKPLKFSPQANFMGFFNPWDEEISIPETHEPIWKLYSCKSSYLFSLLSFDDLLMCLCS